MELKDTISMMTSGDYKERFKAEYFQTKIRHKKLSAMLEKYAQGTLAFKPTCPLHLLVNQRDYMTQYLDCLKQRAEVEKVNLED